MLFRSLFLFLASSLALSASEVSFARDIRPILSDRCFKCHGFDDQSREADLGLHTFAEATRDLGGYRAIKPGDPDGSELIARIISHDPDEVMPSPKANKPRLTENEVALFRQWIAEGAEYEDHWAFSPPARPPLPEAGKGWARNGIDHFVAQGLTKNELTPSPEADPITLLRRVSFDLVGLPPTLAESEVFLARWKDDPEAAWRELLDRLLASSAYGERWARQWLDLARYSDTNGYEKDRDRSIWPWRDWVIKALNADMPFDQFSIEQLAGDLLPNATLEQRIATGFHRNTMLNEEGGIDPLEYRYLSLVDRVATTGTVWMGLTTGCAQCHTHKFDPILHTDYFGMMAMFNQCDEPNLEVPDEATAKKQQAFDQRIAKEEKKLLELINEEDFAKWLQGEKAASAEWTALEPVEATSNRPRLTHEGDGIIVASGDFTKRDTYNLSYRLGVGASPITALRLEALSDPRLPGRGPGACYYEGRNGIFHLSEISATVDGETVRIAHASDNRVLDGNGSSGWSSGNETGRDHDLILIFEKPLPTAGLLRIEILFERHFVAALGKFRISATSATHNLKPRTRPPVDPLTAGEEEIKRVYLRTNKAMAEIRKELEKLEASYPQPVTTLVMQGRPADHQRVTHLHHRGEYLQAKEAVPATTPSFLPALPEGQEANRLNFARWLVDPERNPLIGRVTVNRAWQSFFGKGFVASGADFGYQSDLPSHPELLDWLAVEFVEQGWSLKNLHRLIVESATYRQASSAPPESWQLDPNNRWLGRGPRFRLDGEMIRDAALKSSGLLNEQVGGPSVRPPQPQTVTAAAYGSPPWHASTGPDRYRRSLYTFAKRTAPFAAYLSFDGPTGEVCLPSRERSNSPLQALTLLNDQMFTEAAIALARSSQEEAVGDDSPFLASLIFQRVLTREPTEEELTALLAFHQKQQGRFDSGELDARPFGGDKDLGAWSLVARAILNLDEAITKN